MTKRAIMRITCSLSLAVKLIVVVLIAGLVAGFYLGNWSASADPGCPAGVAPVGSACPDPASVLAHRVGTAPLAAECGPTC
jgi:hypothetical protein